MSNKPSISRALVLFATACAVMACGGHAQKETQPGGAPPPECEAFLGSLQHCLNSLGPANIASARVAQARASLQTQLARGPDAREAVRHECVANLAHMTCQ